LLPGRGNETGVLSKLLSGVRAGQGASLVLRGEAGIGKTALIDAVVADTPNVRVLRAIGVESETELGFGAMHQLCGPVLDLLPRLPGPQADALSIVFGLSMGPAPDRLLVSLAVLSLLAELSAERPVVCVADDAHWMDRESAQALGFAARRLSADPVFVVFAVREPVSALSGIPELVMGGLRRRDARMLLDSVVPWPLDDGVRERVVAETRGNPLALLELPRGLTPAAMAGGFGLTGALPRAEGTEDGTQEVVRYRIEGLPAEVRLLLAAAAAEPTGDPALVWRAAATLGLDSEAITQAFKWGLLEIDGRLVFHHPLARSAAYCAASPEDRRRVHEALAAATNADFDSDRRAWHRARAATDTAEEVALELEGSAGRARIRGGAPAAAAFLERAAGLTAEPKRRAQRELAAAQAKHDAGAHDSSLDLLARAESGSLNDTELAHAALLRAQIVYAQNRGNEAAPLLLRAARRMQALDGGLARQTYLDALGAAHFAGRLSVPGSGILDVAEAAREGPKPEREATASDLLLDGLTAINLEGYAVGVPILKQAVDRFNVGDVTPGEEQHSLWPASHAALIAWDDESYQTLSGRHVDLGRRTGSLAVLPTVMSARIVAHALAGELAAAEQLIREQRTMSEAVGSPLPPYGLLITAGWRGRKEAVRELKASTQWEVTRRGEGAGLAVADYASAVLYNGLGRYRDALAAAVATDDARDGFAVRTLGLVEMIEAAVRCGEVRQAGKALGTLSDMASTAGTDWVCGVQARSAAFLSEARAAEDLYREAIERLGRTRIRVELARSHLAYGEWLRREGRRADARQQLHVAHQMMSEMGLEAFAGRAGRELLAIGETVRARRDETRFDLTTQEHQIASMAADGLTNPEIGAQLFISARTVEWHLRKVFAKLGITSRRDLHRISPERRQMNLSA
jgi:DNA-binding CsgD family transcriptional regulator